MGVEVNFKKLIHKNAIKHKIGDPLSIFPESLDPPQGFWQKLELPSSLDFQPVCIYE
jgi:hypothetical protein